MTETLIKVENLSKKFCKSLKRSMFYGVKDIIRSSFGQTSRSSVLRKDEFWALDDISFELKRGESLGIIGPNGAGKSTLLKLLNGILMPDKGTIEINGKVGALIQVGAGFHPLLTGRENIYINGSILGMSKKEIDKKFDSIIDFADIGDFIDTPVKFYSSGMFVRLGFAIAIHCEPDILLIDEILAVGDLLFRAKCYNKIIELQKNFCIIFVSHNLQQIARISNNILHLEHGNQMNCNAPQIVINQYLNSLKINKTLNVLTGKNFLKKFDVVTSKEEKNIPVIHHGETLKINLSLDLPEKHKNYDISITFNQNECELIGQFHSKFNQIKLYNSQEIINCKIEINNLLLNPGEYTINIIVYDSKSKAYIVWIHNLSRLRIMGEYISNAKVQLLGKIQ